MDLPTLWFIIVAVFWTGFFVLEGFDFGVGMLHTLVGRTEGERRVAINAIGPFWDGNEVWLIVAGAAIFAAFPGWYATMFSSLYLALLLVLLALMARGVSFEFRGKLEGARWRRAWTWATIVGSALIPFLLGVGLGDVVHGLPIGSDHEYTGNFIDLLTPYGLLVGATLLLLSLLHGAAFLGLKTVGDIRARAHAIALRVWWPAAVAVVALAVWTGGFVIWIAAAALLAAIVCLRAQRDGWAFAATAAAMAASVAGLFVDLHPNVMVSSTSSAYSLTIAGTASGHYALTVMTVAAAIFTPLVLLYQGWTYHVFRGRLSAPQDD
jgi:cytochrome bd ubiquinol oxidase subunit II